MEVASALTNSRHAVAVCNPQASIMQSCQTQGARQCWQGPEQLSQGGVASVLTRDLLSTCGKALESLCPFALKLKRETGNDARAASFSYPLTISLSRVLPADLSARDDSQRKHRSHMQDMFCRSRPDYRRTNLGSIQPCKERPPEVSRIPKSIVVQTSNHASMHQCARRWWIDLGAYRCMRSRQFTCSSICASPVWGNSASFFVCVAQTTPILRFKQVTLYRHNIDTPGQFILGGGVSIVLAC